MKYGRWIPIAKAFAKYLPSDRPFTELEAAFSLQLDYDHRKTVTLNGYAKRWRWGKGRVIRFLKKMEVKIVYPMETRKKQNQRGLIAILITDRQRTEYDPIRLVDSKCLNVNSDRKRAESEIKKDGSRYSTINPDNNHDPEQTSPSTLTYLRVPYSKSFESWWEHYPRKVAKDDAFRSWKKIGQKNTTTPQQIIHAIKKQVEAKHFRGKDGQDYIPNPSTWLNQGRWKDEIKEHRSDAKEYVI